MRQEGQRIVCRRKEIKGAGSAAEGMVEAGSERRGMERVTSEEKEIVLKKSS